MNKNLIFTFFCIALITSCTEMVKIKNVDMQGHRGCRGLLPENTIPAFIKAIDLGMNTMELDLAITKDSQVIVSHEPFFNHEISTNPEGIEVTEENEKEFNIYKMDFAEVIKWDVGLKPHPRFPDQEKMNVSKPLLLEVFIQCEAYAKSKGLNPLYYNIEIKSHPKYDGVYHPEVSEFVDLVMSVVKSQGLVERTIIQSFDNRSLIYVHENYPEVATALLIENALSIDENITNLGFVPSIYSPNQLLVTKEVLKYCNENNIRLIPWTVNSPKAIRTLINKGVDGIITDYPDRLAEAYNSLKEKTQ